MRLLPKLLLCSVAFVISSHAQEEAKTYVLASKNPPFPVGQTFKVTTKRSSNETPFSLTIEGGENNQVVTGSLMGVDRKVVKHEFLTEDRVRVTYLRDISTGKRTVAGEEEEINERKPTDGRSFLAVKKDGKWVVDPKPKDVEKADQEAIDEAIEKIEKRLNRERQTSLKMYGEQPRKIGETWEVDAAVIPGMDDIEVLGGKVKVTLVGVEEFKGDLCAILKGKFSVAGQMKEKSMKGVGIDVAGSVRIVRSLKYFHDYKSSGTMNMKVLGEMKIQAGVVGTFRMSGDSKIEVDMVKLAPARKE